MIIIRLWGGLGNQLFQYSYGYNIAKRLGEELLLDVSFYNKQSLREVNILKFNLDFKEIINVSEVSKLIPFINKKIPNKLIRIFKHSCIHLGDNLYYLKETRYKVDKKLLNFNKNNSYIDGYFQSYKYFRDYNEEILRQFDLQPFYSKSVQKFMNDTRNINTVSLHVRRGDYKKINLFSKLLLLSESYFFSAISKTKELVEGANFYVFTDDVSWSKEIFKNLDNVFIFSELYSCNDIEEVAAMSLCKNNIISNSTFSWWGAYLNKNKDKVIICPKNGWANKDILPNDWIKLDEV